MFNYMDSDPAVTNCTFSGNSATFGGGMFNNGSSPTVTNCTFSANTAGSGGGMYNLWGSNRTVAAGGSLIVTMTSGFNFDTSEVMGFGCFDPLPVWPIVHVTVGGVTTDYHDTQRIITSGGHDAASSCDDRRLSSDINWKRINGAA